MRWVKGFVWLAIILFAVDFSIQNKEELVQELALRYSIRNHQLFEVSGVPLFLVIFCSVSLGVLIGGIWDLYRRVQLKKTLRENQRTIERLEREIQSSGISGEDQPSLRKQG